MSGQFGFTATDPVPPLNGYDFAAEDIEELGLGLCIRVARRTNAAEGAPTGSPADGSEA